MSKVVIEIETDNDAFRMEDGTLDLDAVSYVIAQANRKMDKASEYGFRNLQDENGNTCGLVRVLED